MFAATCQTRTGPNNPTLVGADLQMGLENKAEALADTTHQLVLEEMVKAEGPKTLTIGIRAQIVDSRLGLCEKLPNPPNCLDPIDLPSHLQFERVGFAGLS